MPIKSVTKNKTPYHYGDKRHYPGTIINAHVPILFMYICFRVSIDHITWFTYANLLRQGSEAGGSGHGASLKMRKSW